MTWPGWSLANSLRCGYRFSARAGHGRTRDRRAAATWSSTTDSVCSSTLATRPYRGCCNEPARTASRRCSSANASRPLSRSQSAATGAGIVGRSATAPADLRSDGRVGRGARAGPARNAGQRLPCARVHRRRRAHCRPVPRRNPPAAALAAQAGVRLAAEGRVVAYTGDTGPSPEVVALARGADLLLAEATYVDQVPEDSRRHLSSARQAGLRPPGATCHRHRQTGPNSPARCPLRCAILSGVLRVRRS